MDALDRLGETADLALKLDAWLELWVSRISTGQFDGLRELGERAEALARSINDGPRLARVQVRQAQALAIMWLIPGTFDSAVERAREAFHRADPGDLRTRSYAQYIAGLSCRDVGRFRDAMREYGQAIALFRGNLPSGEVAGLVFPIYVSLCAWRSEVYATIGEFDEALASATEALRMATEIRHFSSLTLANAHLGYVQLLRGDVETGLSSLERGLAIGQEHDLIHGVIANSLYLGYGLLLLGHRQRGLECVSRALQRSVGAFMPQWTRYGTVTAGAFLTGGRLTEARAEIAQGLALATAREARGYRAPLLRFQAEVVGNETPSDVEGALGCLEDGLTLATDLGMRPEVAHGHAALARLHRRAGDRARAQAHLATATARFRELGMTFWATQAEAELDERA